MRNGTQEELDAAREDALLIPGDAKFMISKTSSWGKDDLEDFDYAFGDVVFRDEQSSMDAKSSVGFSDGNGKDIVYFDASDLEVIHD